MEAGTQTARPLMVRGVVEKKANLMTQFSQEMMRALVKEEPMGIERKEWI